MTNTSDAILRYLKRYGIGQL